MKNWNPIRTLNGALPATLIAGIPAFGDSHRVPARLPAAEPHTTTRNPLLWLRLSGVFLLRFAARQFLGLLFQLPPRRTRLMRSDPHSPTGRQIPWQAHSGAVDRKRRVHLSIIHFSRDQRGSAPLDSPAK